jgi:phosphopantothenoylcysteine synthetase/decarboxylase
MAASILKDKRVLITSGPMRAPIDAIRCIVNTSTGELGALLAREALSRGAEVTFVCGEGSARPEADRVHPEWSDRLAIRPVATFDDLMRVMGQELGAGGYHIVLHAMAVLDYVPEKRLDDKVPSGQDRWTVTLVPTPKIIQMIKRWDPGLFLVGFKLQAGGGREELIEAATACARKSGADLVVANELGQIRSGQHQALVVEAGGRVEGSFLGKEQIARGLLDLVESRLKGEK